MYGTRDAAFNWERAYISFLEKIGFVSGKYNPCVLFHKERQIRLVVHGDDFAVLGVDDQLDWFRKEIVKRFEVKFKARLGPGIKDDKQVRVLNRII